MITSKFAPPSSGDGSVEFRQYGEIFRRRWWLVVLGIVVGIALSVGAVIALPKTYSSTASVLVEDTGPDAGRRGAHISELVQENRENIKRATKNA